MIERTDELLALSFRERGDREALSALAGRYATPIYSYLLRLLKNPHDAEEAAQDCFVRMMRGLPGYQAELPFRPWLYRIALNCARTTAARRKEQANRERLAASSRPKGAKGMNPADAAVRNEILKLLDELPESQKEAMTLHYCQGLSHSEVASVLEEPAGTIATRIHSGLQSLRARLAALGIATAGLQFEELLSSAEAATAPSSILSTVLSAAAQSAPSGAGVAAVVQGGILVAKSQISVMVAVAIACVVGGGVAGYSVRANRVEPLQETADVRARPRPLAVAPGGAASPTAAPAAARSTPALPGTPGSAPAVAPADARASKVRKAAGLLAKLMKKSDGGKKIGETDPKDMLEFFALMLDPDMQQVLTEASTGGQLAGDLYFALMEEFGVQLSDGQKAQFARLFEEDGARRRQMEVQSATAVDWKISDLRASHDLSEKMMSLLTPEQREKAASLTRLNPGMGPGVVVKAESPERTVPSLLKAWSERLTPLSDEERARLTQAATVHANQVMSLQEELRSRYGGDFVDRIAGQFGSGSSPIQDDPDYARKSSDAYCRFLELERQNRVNLMAILPEKAEAIRKAEPVVYFISTKR